MTSSTGNDTTGIYEDIVILATENEEMARVLAYLALKDTNTSMQSIADTFGFKTRQSVYDLVAKWRDSGLLEKARQVYLLPKAEETAAAMSRIVDKVPVLLARMERIALFGKDHTSMEAVDWLWANVVRPVMESRKQVGDQQEQAWAAKAMDGLSDPMKLKIPSIAKAKDETVLQQESTTPA